MDYALYLIAPLVGFAGMMSGGYWGVGCGWIVVPTMLILGFDTFSAIGIGLLQMLPPTILTVYRQYPEIGWKRGEPGRTLALPIAAGAFLTSLAGKSVNTVLIGLWGAETIQWLIIAMILFLIFQTLCSRTACYGDALPEIGPRKSGIAFGTGLLTGLVSSMLGVGGGILVRPLLTSGFRMPEYYTSRIVRFLLLVTTGTGGLTYLFHSGGIDWHVLWISMLVAFGGMFGFPVGVRMHTIVYDGGYAQHIHKSFGFMGFAVLTNTILNMAGLEMFSRFLMLALGFLLCVYLFLFTLYTKKHPRETAGTGGVH